MQVTALVFEEITIFDLITALKHTVKQFPSLPIKACVFFIHFFKKAYVVGTHVNCLNWTNRDISNEYQKHMLFLTA